MNVIHKVGLFPHRGSEQTVLMPPLATIVRAEYRAHMIDLWFSYCATGVKTTNIRTFRVVGTGEGFTGRYVATVIEPPGTFVWHVTEQE